MPVQSSKFGPGSLTFSTPTSSDWSCQLSKLRVTPTKDADDAVTMLCGDVKPGDVTYGATIDGTLDQDLADPAGVVYWTWEHRGEAAEFVFVPNDTAVNSVTGTCVIDPVMIGGDEGGKDMTSDFSFACVGFPELTAV
jgi:hypothetical protein